jgi:hypothetical protein
VIPSGRSIHYSQGPPAEGVVPYDTFHPGGEPFPSDRRGIADRVLRE